MMSFRDREFCDAPCSTRPCRRALTPEVKAEATAWWGGPGAPIATRNRAAQCADFRPLARQESHA